MTVRRFTPRSNRFGSVMPFDSIELYHLDEATDEELKGLLRGGITPRWLVDEAKAELETRDAKYNQIPGATTRGSSLNPTGTASKDACQRSRQDQKRTGGEEEMSGQDAACSDGSTASYYKLPTSCFELQHLISYRDMNAQIGEIFRACYRYGRASHSDCLRDAKKILFYAQAEVERLEKL